MTNTIEGDVERAICKVCERRPAIICATCYVADNDEEKALRLLVVRVEAVREAMRGYDTDAYDALTTALSEARDTSGIELPPPEARVIGDD